jgi:hypothetical protein
MGTRGGRVGRGMDSVSAAGARQTRKESAVAGTQGHVGLEVLLRNFLSAAVGLRLTEAVRAAPALAAATGSSAVAVRADPAGADTCYAWRTEAGVVRARGHVDVGQSQMVGATVVFIEWWGPPNTHYAGWWRCDLKRPREWTYGRGQEEFRAKT